MARSLYCEQSEQLDVEPAKYFALVTKREKRGCRCCHRGVVTAPSPARIIAIDAPDPTRISKEYEVPAAGPHGLDLDPATGRLLCACDAGVLFAIDAASGRVLGDVSLSGVPDVVFLNPQFGRLYVAIGVFYVLESSIFGRR